MRDYPGKYELVASNGKVNISPVIPGNMNSWQATEKLIFHQLLPLGK
jgi:hypothetical protein